MYGHKKQKETFFVKKVSLYKQSKQCLKQRILTIIINKNLLIIIKQAFTDSFFLASRRFIHHIIAGFIDVLTLSIKSNVFFVSKRFRVD